MRVGAEAGWTRSGRPQPSKALPCESARGGNILFAEAPIHFHVVHLERSRSPNLFSLNRGTAARGGSILFAAFVPEGAKPPRTPSVVYRPPSPTRRRTRGEPSCTPSVIYRPPSSPPLTRASEGRRPESESKSLICEPPGAKPPRALAVVLRPLFSSGVLRKRGAASAYPYGSQGRASAYTLRRLSPTISYT